MGRLGRTPGAGSAGVGGPATNLVTSVAGRDGVVILTKADVGLSDADNTADVAKPVSTAQAAADALAVLKAGDMMTGLLTLQPNIAGRALLVRPGHAAGDGIQVNLNTAALYVLSGRVTGDTQTRFMLTAAGLMTWGPGGATAPDTNLYRSAADTLKTDDSLEVAGTLAVTGVASGPTAAPGTDTTQLATTAFVTEAVAGAGGGGGAVSVVVGGTPPGGDPVNVIWIDTSGV